MLENSPALGLLSNSPFFVKTNILLQSSYQLITSKYPEPDESISHTTPNFHEIDGILRKFLSHRSPGLPSRLSYSGFLNKVFIDLFSLLLSCAFLSCLFCLYRCDHFVIFVVRTVNSLITY